MSGDYSSENVRHEFYMWGDPQYPIVLSRTPFEIVRTTVVSAYGTRRLGSSRGVIFKHYVRYEKVEDK